MDRRSPVFNVFVSTTSALPTTFMLIGISPVLLLLPPLQINIITPRLRPPPLPFSLLGFIVLIGLILALSKTSTITHISTLFIMRVISLIVS